MKKIDYTALDAAILASISGGTTKAGLIMNDCFSQATACLTGRDDCQMRAVDRRLQSLRNKGKITFGPVGLQGAPRWSLA